MSLALKATRGAIWTILGSFLGRGATLVGTLILTYFLAPEVIGEVGVAHVAVFSANQLSIVGFGQYLIAKPGLSRQAVFQVTALNLLFAVVAMGVVWVLADSLASAFRAPNMAVFVPGLVVAALVQRVGLVPSRILTRDLRFKRLSLGRFAGELTYVGVSVGMAANGSGGEAIVWGNIARAFLTALIYVASVSRADWLLISPFDRAQVRDVFRFGIPISVGSTLNFAARRWDNLLISAVFGPTTMGLYKMAYNLADVPATQVGEHIGDVLMPSFARMAPNRARAALVKGTTLLALLVFPLAIGLGAVAPTLVPVLLNDEWSGVAPLLMALAGLSVVRPIGWTINSYLQARDLPVAVMWLAFIKLATLLAAMYALSFFGAIWATAGVGIGFGIEAAVSLVFARKLDQVEAWAVVKGLLGPFLACGVMVAAVLGAREGVSAVGGPLWLSLAAEIVAGAVAYVAACFVVAREPAYECLRLLKNALRRGGGEPGQEEPPPA